MDSLFSLRGIFRLPGRFEFWFVMFLFAGEFKKIPAIRGLIGNIDLLAVFLAITYLVFFLNLKKRYLVLRSSNLTYIFLYLLFVIYVITNFNLDSFGEVANIKLRDFLLVVPNSVFFGLIFANHKESRIFFVKSLLYLAMFLIIAFVLQTLTSGVQSYERSGVYSDSYHRIGFIGATSGGIFLWMILTFRGIGKRWFIISLYMLAFIAVSLSGHRAGFVGFFVTSLVALATYFRQSRRTANGLILLAFLVIGLTAIVSYTSFLESVTARFSSLQATGTQNVRVVMFVNAITAFEESPIFGNGFGMFGTFSGMINYRHPHNIFAEILSELGIVGMILFLPVYFGWLFKKSVFSEDRVLFILIFTSAFVYSIFSGEISEHRVLLMSSACLFSFVTPQMVRNKIYKNRA
ncbi:MAG: O-antigen ligase family protein [Oceanospirillaceae bacterium]|nr:O-antigen ligase family protein [Oceanospirillaceae bacterium]